MPYDLAASATRIGRVFFLLRESEEKIATSTLHFLTTEEPPGWTRARLNMLAIHSPGLIR
jgi:hypothetical protein